MVTRTLFCDYIVKYFSAHPAGVSLSFAGFKEASSHLGEPHVGRNCGKPQGAQHQGINCGWEMGEPGGGWRCPLALDGKWNKPVRA